MGSKRYRDRPCVYCVRDPATTADHVFARSLLAEGRTDHLPKVPACQPCNKEKSDLEHYLATVLPFGGRHQDAKHVLEMHVHRRLAKNLPLHRMLAQGMQYVTLRGGSDEIKDSITIPFEGEKLMRWLSFVVRGLLWHHWQIVLNDEHDVRPMVLAEHGEEIFLAFHAAPAKERVVGDLGGGTFRYNGAQGKDYPEFSAWAFDIFGGALFSDGDVNSEATAALCALTGRKSFFEGAAFRGVFGDDPA